MSYNYRLLALSLVLAARHFVIYYLPWLNTEQDWPII